MYVLWIVVCPFVLFLLAIVLSVLFRYTDSDYPFGISKLFLWQLAWSFHFRCLQLPSWIGWSLCIVCITNASCLYCRDNFQYILPRLWLTSETRRVSYVDHRTWGNSWFLMQWIFGFLSLLTFICVCPCLFFLFLDTWMSVSNYYCFIMSWFVLLYCEVILCDFYL